MTPHFQESAILLAYNNVWSPVFTSGCYAKWNIYGSTRKHSVPVIEYFLFVCKCTGYITNGLRSQSNMDSILGKNLEGSSHGLFRVLTQY
jgi:hypothetical protein